MLLYDARESHDARQAQHTPIFEAWMASDFGASELARMALVADREGYDCIGFNGAQHHSPGAISYTRNGALEFYSRLLREDESELRHSACGILAFYGITIESITLSERD